MIASEHCSGSLYNSQYHSVKMESDYNFKQEPDLLLSNRATTDVNNTTIACSSSLSPSSDMTAYQSNHQYQQQLTQQHSQLAPWYPQHVSSNTNQNYPTDDLFYAGLPPPPTFSIPSPLPKKKPIINRNHPRHRSANGILQQYAHYHYQHPQQQQQQLTQVLQRQSSSSTATSTLSPPSSTFNTPPTYSSCVTPNIQYASTSSTSSSPTDSLFSTELSTMTLKKYTKDDALKKPTSTPISAPLRYHITLQTSTTAAQRIGESSPMTYLNRGQAYGIQFLDQQQTKDTLITSTISITFHDAAHRQTSQNYWRFWLSQQDRPNEARALDLDAQQSAGLTSVHYPSFDRITIQWQAHAGATLFVRFNCLSTDFSRIKGVKGIPLRVLVETTATSTAAPSSPLEYDGAIERSFCKIKLFRDKGAERKNKDDAKQISKQLEKLKAEGNPQHNPLWHFYNQSVLPYSTFKALPEGDEVIKDDFTAPIVATSTPATYALTSQPTSAVTTSSSMSSPLSSIANSPMQTFVNGGLQLQTYQQPLPHHDSNMTIGSSFYPAAFSYPQQHFVQPSSGFVFNPMTSPPPTSSPLGYSPSWSSSSGRKRSQSHMVVSTHPSPPEDQPPMKRHHASLPVLTLFVDTKKNQQPAMENRRIELESLTVQQLILKLSALFSLQASSVTEVLWRRNANDHRQQQKKQQPNQSPPANVLVLVEDCVLEHFVDQSIMHVQWEISSAGMVRFILEF